MEINLSGQVVTSIDIGNTVSIITDAGYELRIEVDFVFFSDGTQEHANLENEIMPGKLHILNGKSINESNVDSLGTLTVTFDKEFSLQIPAHNKYEAWTLTGPAGYKVVCTPGGKIASWSAN